MSDVTIKYLDDKPGKVGNCKTVKINGDTLVCITGEPDKRHTYLIHLPNTKEVHITGDLD